MAENPVELAIGAATLVIATGFVVYATQVTGFGERGAADYTLNASFRSAQGVGPGSDVRLAGVRVGSVADMTLNAETFRADMALSIDGELDVPEDSAVAISSDGLLGSTFVEIVPGDSPFALEPGSDFAETQDALSLIAVLTQVIGAAARD
ncbi:MAG: outer membrane lipid asymmetry maintenance protein MlaD [Pseudomonadota bacterium]